VVGSEWAMVARRIGLAATCAVLLTGCPSSEGAAGRGECDRHSVPVAQARGEAALRHLLLSSALPSVRSLEPETTTEGRRAVRLLNDAGRTVMKVNVWQQPDGTWVARRRSECYRSPDGGCVSHGSRSRVKTTCARCGVSFVRCSPRSGHSGPSR
jgi:hypothetical protein